MDLYTKVITKISASISIIFMLSANTWATGTINKLKTTGINPSQRNSSGVTSVGNDIYLFGGTFDNFVTQDVICYNDLYRFKIKNNSWEKLSPAGTLPAPRGFSIGFSYPKKKQIIIFGGASFSTLKKPGEQPFKDTKMFSDLWAYSIDKNSWTQLKPNNNGPEPRSKPIGWIANDKIYIFAGVNAQWQTLNDLWAYDINKNSWLELIPNGSKDSPPSRHESNGGLAPNSNQSLAIIYGGERMEDGKFSVLNDTWEYNLKTNKWKNITPPDGKNIFPAHNYCSSAVIGNYLYIQSGDLQGVGETNGCGSPFPQSVGDDLWRFDISKHVWERIGAGNDALPRIKRTASTSADGKMYMFVGYDFLCFPNGKPGQIWNNQVYMYNPTG